MDTDEERVKSYLQGRGLISERFSKLETRSCKTPDFRVSRNGELVFYCEVKSSPKDRWLDKLLEDAVPGEVVSDFRIVPIFNRLTADIHEAVKQFDAVNKGEKHPNVLALVNHDKMCGFTDLLAVLTGNFYADNGTVHPIFRQFSDGRINDEKGKIHLFIWLDDYKPDRFFFNQTDETHHASLCALFGFNQSDIKQIGS